MFKIWFKICVINEYNQYIYLIFDNVVMCKVLYSCDFTRGQMFRGPSQESTLVLYLHEFLYIN